MSLQMWNKGCVMVMPSNWKGRDEMKCKVMQNNICKLHNKILHYRR